MLEKIQTMQEKSMQKSAFKEVILPTWHDNKRGTPNTFLRSALFSAIKSRDRADMKGVILASQSGIIVTYTGEQLNQEDLSVWECIIHLAKETPLGITCEFTAYQILKTLGMEDAGENYKQLHNVIIRLTACAVQIQHVGQTFFGSLIASGIRDDKTGHYSITLSNWRVKSSSDSNRMNYSDKLKKTLIVSYVTYKPGFATPCKSTN